MELADEQRDALIKYTLSLRAWADAEYGADKARTDAVSLTNLGIGSVTYKDDKGATASVAVQFKGKQWSRM